VNSRHDQKANSPIRGYLEGYYGKLFSWNERNDLLTFLASLNLNTYCYAPKEDASHRLHWREPYSPQWQESFAHFCKSAQELKVSVVAGIAPGLDFSFEHTGGSDDFAHLLVKAKTFLNKGADEILILWDDIEEGEIIASNDRSEGANHADIVNRLSAELGQPVWTVPRVYAAEIPNNGNYLEDFFSELQALHTVLLCGNATVASNISIDDLAGLSCAQPNPTPESGDVDVLKHRTIVWDNYYANDYCPRRLFLGPWSGREQINEYLINPTGLPYTDRLLLDIAVTTHTSSNIDEDWTQTMERHGVPDAFLSLAPYFLKPFAGDRTVTGKQNDLDCMNPSEEIDHAIEECLWKWKSPLAREWYPFIFGLKHDLALLRGTLPRDRVLKTQSPALAKKLLS